MAVVSGSVLGWDETPVPGAIVKAGNIEGTTDAPGRFSVTVNTRGFIHVTSELPAHGQSCDPQTGSGTTLVKLTGKGAYEGKVTVSDLNSPDESKMCRRLGAAERKPERSSGRRYQQSRASVREERRYCRRVATRRDRPGLAGRVRSRMGV